MKPATVIPTLNPTGSPAVSGSDRAAGSAQSDGHIFQRVGTRGMAGARLG